MLISFKRQIKQEGMDRRVFQHTALGIQALYSMIMCILHAQSPQLHLTLCDLMDYSPPGSSVHGILQAGILEWVAIPSSKGFSWDRRSSQGSNPHLLHLLHWRHIFYRGATLARIIISEVGFPSELFKRGEFQHAPPPLGGDAFRIIHLGQCLIS